MLGWISCVFVPSSSLLPPIVGFSNWKRAQVTQLTRTDTYCKFTLFPMEKKSGVSASIRATKMYSCAQGAMQEKSVCCRDVPCLAHMEQGPSPSNLNTYPPSLSAWIPGIQSTSSSQQGWTWTVEWTPVALGKCMSILFFIFCPVILSFRMLTQMITKWLSA